MNFKLIIASAVPNSSIAKCDQASKTFITLLRTELPRIEHSIVIAAITDERRKLDYKKGEQ